MIKASQMNALRQRQIPIVILSMLETEGDHPEERGWKFVVLDFEHCISDAFTGAKDLKGSHLDSTSGISFISCRTQRLPLAVRNHARSLLSSDGSFLQMMNCPVSSLCHSGAFSLYSSRCKSSEASCTSVVRPFRISPALMENPPISITPSIKTRRPLACSCQRSWASSRPWATRSSKSRSAAGDGAILKETVFRPGRKEGRYFRTSRLR